MLTIRKITKRFHDQKGAVLLLMALSMLILLGFAAFAIDLGYSYVVRNELQNAADAAALAGASVLFNDNRNCLSSGNPYHCCTGAGTGFCSSTVIDNASVIATATAVSDKNNSGGSPVPLPTVEIGHYAFAPTWDTPGVFSVNMSGSQAAGWETRDFSSLNGDTAFINAVRVTVSRTDVPRFFSLVFASDPLTITAQATAYVGFAGVLPPDTVSQPITICKHSIVDANGSYTCSAGNILASGQTAEWTNFTQPCETANASDVNKLICAGGPTGTVNSKALILGRGMGTTHGTQGINVDNLYDCFSRYESQQGANPIPWPLTLPVVECAQGCSTLVGAVVIDVVWVTGNGNDPHFKQVPLKMGNWSCPSTCGGPSECCWNSFVTNFNLQFPVGTPAPYQQKTVYLLPDCSPHAPLGSTGGQNFGILAQFPVLVK